MNFILKDKLLICTKDIIKLFKIVILAFILVSIIVIIKYKPIYAVSVSGQVLGYVENQNEFEEMIESEIINMSGNNIDSVLLTDTISYEVKLVNRNKETNEEKIIAEIKENNTSILYKYYAVVLNDETQSYVDTLEDAEKVVSDIKEEYGLDLELDLQIIEKYTEDVNEVMTDTIEIAETNIETEVSKIEMEDGVPSINGIKLSVLPVQGQISSRYGSISSLRSSAHTGLDIACSKGTDIKVVADGVVTYAQDTNGSYGKLVKVDHGNGVETWYAHCNSISVNVGDTVSAGDVIATVGSTGNSTGPHLHLEIRVDGNTVNPQDYLYN